jgi:membrane-bound metal-dependent hydrolase YbcI (DUF457 family)
MLGEDLPRDVRKPIIWGMLLFASVAPDFDIVINLFRSGNAFAKHGSYSHSLLLAPIFGVLFACAIKCIYRQARPGKVFMIGAGLYALHVMMDLLTHDSRGVSLLWPIMPERIACPAWLFVGVEHSNWKRLDMHLMTLITESVFAAAVYFISKHIAGIRRGHRAHA